MIDETHLYEQAAQELRRRNRELALLKRATRVFKASSDLDEVLSIVLEEVRRLLNVMACSVWLADPVTNELICRQATGPKADIVRGWRLSPGAGIAGWVFNSRKSLIVADVLKDKRHYEEVENTVGLAIRSILCTPLTIKNHPIGVLQVLDTEIGRFDEEHLALMEILAHSAAIAIDNARLIETLRRRSMELESRNAELERLTYLASHQLRSPLVNLQGFSGEVRHAFKDIEALTADLQSHLTPDQRQTIQNVRADVTEALVFIEQSVAELGRLSDALLKLAQLSRCEFSLERIDVEDLIHTVLRTLGDPASEQDIEVIVHPLPRVIADREALTLILRNLLSNALNYLPPNRPGRIEITAESGPEEHTFHIRDNGRGIAEEDMHKIFAPFRRAGTQESPGEGMGLVYAQAMVRRHNGQLWCESERGAGAEFTFTIARYLTKG